MRTSMVLLGAIAIVVGCAAHAQADEETGQSGLAADKRFHPHVVGDVRGLMLVRTNDNYVRHASAFRYDMPGTALGVGITAGVEIIPRIAVLAAGNYEMSGADRADAHLRLASGAVLGLVRWSFVRVGEDDEKLLLELGATAGFGRYLIRETYVNTALSPDSFTHDDGAFGGRAGLEASIVVAGFRAMVGYAFSYSPASIGNRIGGTAYAGGHELALGVGVRL